MIDTHCHLEMDAFDHDREAVIERAFNSGMEAMITIASDVQSNVKAISLSELYPKIYASVGIHPHDARFFNDDIYTRLLEYSKKDKVVAIGETGLDYHYENTIKEIQRNVFIRQLEISIDTGLPVIIHSREAEVDTLNILKEYNISKGVFHCFSGDINMAREVLSLGLYISIPGIITFKKGQTLRDVAKMVPDDMLLVETDSPYLAPVPFRGKRNEPAYVIHTIKAVAEVRNVSVEDVIRLTTLNAKRLFKILNTTNIGVVTYKIRDSLYLNITNRCTNKCSFCIKFQKDHVKGHNLRLTSEPKDDDIIREIGDPTIYKEIVFCGYGEPTIRIDTIKTVASWIKSKGGRVRINTNGHGNIIHKRNIAAELKGLVDTLSISLDAQDSVTYNRLCLPVYDNAFDEVIAFIRESVKYIPEVTATVVNAEGVDVEACERLANNLGAGFRLRKLDDVG
ncbi:MAG: YchF/TatD family DNA exonuclease [Nitrospirae bacterium]|nr:YchF/TatD family DNA exonuclease [Nitrospirota bacterium]